MSSAAVRPFLRLAAERGSFCLVLTNTRIEDPSRLRWLWERAAVRVVADGGADRLRAALPDARPDAIIGDLDSIGRDASRIYSAMGVPVCEERDQNSTDLEKCLRDLDRRRVAVRVQWDAPRRCP